MIAHRRLATWLTAGALVVAAAIGAAAPAHADDVNGFTAVLSASKGAVTVDLGGAVYAVAPTTLTIAALRNGCGPAGTCWAEQDATVTVTSGFDGSYTLPGLQADTPYQVRILGAVAGDFTGYVTTPADVDAAPSVAPLTTVSTDGLHASVTAQAEYADSGIHDGGTIAALRYSVYASVAGGTPRRVLTGVTAGVAHTVTGLPLHAATTFTETDTNSVGESPQSTASRAVTLAPAAPGAFHGTSYPGTTSARVVWKAPAAGAGHLTGFTVLLGTRTKLLFTKALPATARSVVIGHLKRRTAYVVLVSAVNSYGVRTTVYGALRTR